MTDYALARYSPWRLAILRSGVAATSGLLLVVGLFVAARRIGGAFDRPLNSPGIVLLGIGIVVLASCIRISWPRGTREHGPLSSWARLALPSATALLFCYALSVPGSATWAVTSLWSLVLIAEVAWWVRDSPGLLITPPVSSTAGSATELADDGEFAGDVTQQMTRVRNEDGGDLIFGRACAEFVVGERSQSIHLAFCPPLDRPPKISVMQEDGPAAAISVAQTEPFGARIDVRLAGTAQQAERVMVEFEAHVPAPSELSDTATSETGEVK